MKKRYESPELDFEKVSSADVITESGFTLAKIFGDDENDDASAILDLSRFFK